MSKEGALRQQLIDVGVELVKTGGVGSLGLREIARRAGVSHGAPRRYFPTHHALLSAIAQRGFAELTARFATCTNENDAARAQLTALSHSYVEYAVQHSGMFELMFRHDLLDSDKHDSNHPRLRDSTLPLFAHIVTLVERCQRNKRPKQAATVAAASLWANLHGIAQLWIWGSLQLALSDGEAPPKQLDHLIEATLTSHLGSVTE